MKLDQISRDLLAAARYIDKNGFREAGMDHPLNAVARITKPYNLAGSHPNKKRYHAAAGRLHDACGIDNVDLSAAEAIDALVAAAYWTVPQREKMTAENQKVVPLLEELRIEAALVPNRRGQLYRLAAERIDTLERALSERPISENRVNTLTQLLRMVYRDGSTTHMKMIGAAIGAKA